MCASVPEMIGDPNGEGVQSISANLSGSLEPNRAETSACFSCRMFTQNRPLASIACHERDTLVGQNSTSGGSSDSAANDWQANPTGTPSCMVVITVIPVQNWPNTLRNVRGSIGADAISATLRTDREVVPPQAHRRALPGDPVVVVDLAPLATEFDVEPAGGLHVERQHQVVDVATQRRRHRHLAAQCAVQAEPDVVAVPYLDHQVHDSAGRGRRHERQAVVAGV